MPMTTRMMIIVFAMWPFVVSYAFHYRKSVVLAPPAAEFDNAKCLRDLKHVYI